MPARYRGKAPANPVRQAPQLSLKKLQGKRKNLTRSLTKNPINALAQLLLRPEMLAREQKKTAPVTVTLNIAPVTVQETAILVTAQTIGLAITLETIRVAATLTIALALNRAIAPETAPETAREPVIQVVTLTLAPQPVPAIVRETTTRVSNLGSNRSV